MLLGEGLSDSPSLFSKTYRKEELVNMKYVEGNMVILNDNRSVYIISVDKKSKKYMVIDMDDSEDMFEITDKDVLMKI